MPFEKKQVGLRGIFNFFLVAGLWLAIFWFVFLFPEYSKFFYLLISVVGLYITVFYVLTDRTEAPVMPLDLKKFPSVTVLIPSYNSASTLPACLSSVLALNYPRPIEVVVIDDGSKDNTQEILKSFPGVRVVLNSPNIGKAKSLNAAIKKSKSDLIVCIDSDTYPNPNVLLDCIPQFFKSSSVGAVAPFITVANAKTWVQKMQEIEYYSGFGFYSQIAAKLDGLYVAPGPLTIFSRAALVKIGGFDEDNLTEDMEIALRLHAYGYSIGYAPSQVPTEVPSTVKSWYRQRLRWYRGTIFNVFKYREMFFSPKFRAFGKFFFPALTVFVSTILLSFVVIWGLILFSIVQGIFHLYYSLSNGHLPLLRLMFENFTVHSLAVFMAVAIIVWILFFVKSMAMLGQKPTIKMWVPAILAMFFYPFWISFLYTISLFKELKGSHRAW